MCAYSVMADHYQNLIHSYPYPALPPNFDAAAVEQLKKILAAIEALDRKLGQADCGPEKVRDLISDLESRIKALEKRKR